MKIVRMRSESSWQNKPWKIPRKESHACPPPFSVSTRKATLCHSVSLLPGPFVGTTQLWEGASPLAGAAPPAPGLCCPSGCPGPSPLPSCRVPRTQIRSRAFPGTSQNMASVIKPQQQLSKQMNKAHLGRIFHFYFVHLVPLPLMPLRLFTRSVREIHSHTTRLGICTPCPRSVRPQHVLVVGEGGAHHNRPPPWSEVEDPTPKARVAKAICSCQLRSLGLQPWKQRSAPSSSSFISSSSSRRPRTYSWPG